jgi:Ca2+-binding EF-hand superfamily protein
MEWTTSATWTLRPRRITVAVVSVAATASIGYLLYRNFYDDPFALAGPDASRRLHRSNAIRRRRRSLRERAPSDATSTSAESDADENVNALAPLGDGETVADDQNTVEDDWWNDPASAPQQRAGQNIVSLLFRVSEDNARRNAYVHRGCACNACGIVPIRGIRYRCANCADFDLCETCESQGHHINTHIFYKVKIPAPPFGPRQSQPVWYTGDPENCIRKLPKSVMAKLSKETGFERPELEAFWEQWTFMANTEWRDDPDELYLAMDRRTFERCLVPSGGYRHTAPNLIHDRMFAFYDTNNDELIGFSEFLHGLSYRKRKDKLRRIFDGFDMDRDGYVTRKDFLRIFRAYYVLYKQMHKDILEGLDDQVLGSTEVHQLVTGRQPLSGFFGREGRVPPARGSRPLEGKVARDGDMVVNGDDNRVVDEDKPNTADRSTILTSLFHPDNSYGGRNRRRYNDDDDLERASSVSDDSYMMAYAELQESAASPRYWNALLNPPVGIEELPSLLAGDPRPGDDLFVSNEDPDANHSGGDHPQAETHITADGGNTSGPANADGPADEDEAPPLEHITGNPWRIAGSRVEPADLTRHVLAEHSRKVAKAKRDRAIIRDKLLDRWRRRQFYLDEEEGVVAPDGWEPGSDDPLGYRDPNWEAPKTGQQVPLSGRSRASSKVRFAENTDDYDSHSNPSTSSRSVPERWGGIDIPHAERDAGKEILYQVTQQAYNELLDVLFKKKEDDALMAAMTKAEREQYKELIDQSYWDDVGGEYGPSDGSKHEDLEDFRNKSLGELLAQSGYAVDPALVRQGREANDEILAEVDSMYDAAAAVEVETLALGRPATAAAETDERDGKYRDPTMPQFRPNSAVEALAPTSAANHFDEPVASPAEHLNGASQPPKDKGKAPASDEVVSPGTLRADDDVQPPNQEKRARSVVIDRKSLQTWKSCQMAEDEAKARGGWGRLSFEEFEKMYKDEERRDNRLDYLGSWIDFCIP